ncbi:porin [Paraburkholderia kururiensis]|uniref:porin n=1 Tax=Paraburkholderia kururiensis TaxID=984307 RepID=UPI0005AB2E53|nr:porin [Paraburkholderia kururiensis]
MKKSLLSVAVLATVCGTAHAQSSVTLYGVIDEGFDFTSNAGGKRAYELASGVLQGNRWGLKGTEDLGGGLRAIFQLENGFSLNSGALGQGGREFGRQAYVGLSSNSAGTVTLGRQYDSMVDYVGPLTANGSWGGTFFSHPLDNDNTNNSFRINNSIKYTSVNYGGFSFGGLYGFSNEPGSQGNNRAWSLGASYDNGPLKAAAAYLQLNRPGTTSYGAVTSDANFVADRQRVAGAGVNYTFGMVTLGGVFTYTNLNNTGALSSLIFTNYEVNARFALTPALSLGAMYDYTHVRAGAQSGAVGKGHWNQAGVMADYALSKRTDVYGQVVYQQGQGIAPTYISGTSGVSSNDHQVVTRVGIRHKF